MQTNVSLFSATWCKKRKNELFFFFPIQKNLIGFLSSINTDINNAKSTNCTSQKDKRRTNVGWVFSEVWCGWQFSPLTLPFLTILFSSNIMNPHFLYWFMPMENGWWMKSIQSVFLVKGVFVAIFLKCNHRRNS